MENTLEGIASVKAALQEAAVAIQLEIQSHGTWTGRALSDFESKTSTKGGETNASGDKVLALDLLADAAVENALKKCPDVAGFASEEREGFVSLNSEGKYIVVFDPLDGSQNVPVGISVGAIFGVFEGKSLEDLQSGDDIVAACYALFSGPLLFCYGARDTKLSLEQYDFVNANWVSTIADHKMPVKGKTYCINEGSSGNWDSFISAYVAQCLRGRSVRWACCMVVDVHRPLLQGGCFLYPEDKKYPSGRLRLVYEGYPLAFLWEKAGGTALANVDGERVLSRSFPHQDVHSRCGIIMLGPDESKRFNHMRENLPLWAGGTEKAKVVKEQVKHDTTVQSELKYLRIALVVGAICQLALFFRK